MTLTASTSHSANLPPELTLTEPLLPVASRSASELSLEKLPAQNAENTAAAMARLSGGGTAMRRLLNSAVDGLAEGVSAAYDAGYLSVAGFNNIVKPAGSILLKASVETVKNFAKVAIESGLFIQETVTGVELVAGHTVSARADSILRFPQRLIPSSVKELFTDDGTGLSEKGLAFLKNVGAYAGGTAASFIYATAIVSIADTIGRVSAQATSDELEEGNFAVPLAVTGALTLVAAGQVAFLVKSMNLGDLSENQKSAVIAAHHGITQETFDAMPDADKATLGGKFIRDCLAMAGGAALMPLGAFAMNLIATLSPAAFANPLFMTIAENMTKEVVRSALYGGLREIGQEVFTGPKGGSANLTHAEARWSAIKYVGIETAVDQGQSAAARAVTHNSLLAPANAWAQAEPSTSTWGERLSMTTAPELQATHLLSTWKEKVSVLAAYSVVNAIGESVNWADDTSDRAKKCAELAKRDLVEQHRASGMAPPTPDQLKTVAAQAEFAFDLGIKDQSFAQALRNIGRRAGGAMVTRRGLYAYVNAMATSLAKLENTLGIDSSSVVNSILVSAGISLAYIKFNACAQSLGTLRAVRAENENRATAPELA